jgi:hypothetical protein
MKANEKARERDAMDDGGKEKDKSRTQDDDDSACKLSHAPKDAWARKNRQVSSENRIPRMCSERAATY